MKRQFDHFPVGVAVVLHFDTFDLTVGYHNFGFVNRFDYFLWQNEFVHDWKRLVDFVSNCRALIANETLEALDDLCADRNCN